MKITRIPMLDRELNSTSQVISTLVVENLAKGRSLPSSVSRLFRFHKGQPPLFDLSCETADLLFVEEEFPGASGLMVKLVGCGIWADVSINEKGLVLINTGVTVLEVRFPLTKRLYFTPH